MPSVANGYLSVKLHKTVNRWKVNFLTDRQAVRPDQNKMVTEISIKTDTTDNNKNNDRGQQQAYKHRSLSHNLLGLCNWLSSFASKTIHSKYKDTIIEPPSKQPGQTVSM
jgi:hypothetical protein